MSPPPVSIHKEGLVNHYQRPDIKAILEQIRRARLRVRLAMNAASAGQASQELMACWQAYVHGKTMACLIHEQKSSDPQGSSELEFYLHEDGPIKASLAQAFKAIADCRFREEILPQIRPFHLESALFWSELSSERIQSECEAEAAKVRAISDWLAQSRIFCLGQRWPLAALPALLESPQRSIRRAAVRGIQDFILTHEDWLNLQIGDLLDLRSQMAKKIRLSHPFEMTRHLAGLRNVTEDQFLLFKSQIQHYFVPMGLEIRRLQRKRLNLETLSEQDFLCFLPDGHPVPTLSRDIQFQIITRVLTQLLQQNPDSLTLDGSCLEHPLIDFQLGPDMYGETTAYLLSSQGPVYWRLPHHGTMMDIGHHLHASGPLLAALADQAIARAAGGVGAPAVPDVARSTLQAYLTELVAQPHLGELIQENELHHLLRLTQLSETLVLLTLWADFSFQIHQENLKDPRDRSRLWLELEHLYLPDLTHEDWPYWGNGGLQHLAHEAWLKPGDSLARALGLFAALAIWQKSRKTPDLLSQDWTRMIGLGNSLPFDPLLEQFTSLSPWDEASFKRVAFAISAELSL